MERLVSLVGAYTVDEEEEGQVVDLPDSPPHGAAKTSPPTVPDEAKRPRLESMSSFMPPPPPVSAMAQKSPPPPQPGATASPTGSTNYPTPGSLAGRDGGGLSFVSPASDAAVRAAESEAEAALRRRYFMAEMGRGSDDEDDDNRFAAELRTNVNISMSISDEEFEATRTVSAHITIRNPVSDAVRRITGERSPSSVGQGMLVPEYEASDDSDVDAIEEQPMDSGEQTPTEAEKENTDVTSEAYGPEAPIEPLDINVLDRSGPSYDSIALPPEPPGQCSKKLQENFEKMFERGYGMGDIEKNKWFRNPSIYEKLVERFGINDRGTNFQLQQFDPDSWGKESFYDELQRVQNLEQEKRDEERKKKQNVEFVPEKARKSRFSNPEPVVAKKIPTTGEKKK